MRHRFDKYFLVIEDEEEIADLLKSLIEEAIPSSHVVIADSSLEAKRKLALQKFNTIIVDLNLNKSMGDELPKYIRSKNEFNKETPLIICSGMISQTRISILSKYTKHFFVKPFDMDKLINIIKKLVKKDEKNNLQKHLQKRFSKSA